MGVICKLSKSFVAAWTDTVVVAVAAPPPPADASQVVSIGENLDGAVSLVTETETEEEEEADVLVA